MSKILPSSREQVQRLVEVEVEMSVEMASHKFVDFFFTFSMKILELVKISLHIEPVRSENIWLPLHKVFTLQPSYLTHCGEHM